MRIKKTVVFLLILAVLFTSGTGVLAKDQIKVYFDGAIIEFDVPPALIGGRTLVPVRKIFETLGATVDFDPSTSTITATRTKAGDGTRKIILKIGNSGAEVIHNGTSSYFLLDVPALIIQGRTLVPLRFIGEALDTEVNWTGSTKTVNILTINKQPSVSEIFIANTNKYKRADAGFLDSFSNYRPDNTMQTNGSANVAVFLVQFPDMKNQDPSITSQYVEHRLFNNKNDYIYPYDNLTDYYLRSSYGKMHITGEVFGWYTAKMNRDRYEVIGGIQALAEEVMQFYDSNIDYRRFDADDDGVIDSVHIIYAGGNTGSDSVWWNYSLLSSPVKTANKLDGMAFSRMVLTDTFFLTDESSTIFTQTAIHEFGHQMGAVDYYDWIGGGFVNNGGSKSFDIMDQLDGDHNALTKLMYGWIDSPVVISGDAKDIFLKPFARDGEVALIYPYEGNREEFFIVENITQINNYSKAYPMGRIDRSAGLRIYRINTRDSGFNNAGDGIKLIEAVKNGPGLLINSEKYDYEWSLYRSGDSFTPYSVDSSYLYTYDLLPGHVSGKFSGVWVYNIREYKEGIAFDVRIEKKPQTKPVTFKNIELSDNQIMIEANTDIFNTGVGRPYLTDKIDKIEFDVYSGQVAGSDTRKSIHTFIFDDKNQKAQLKQGTEYWFVIPKGMFVSGYGALNDEAWIPIEQAYFPDIATSQSYDIDVFRKVLPFYKISDTHAARIVISGTSDDDSFTYVFDRIGTDGSLSSINTGLKYSASYEFASSCQLASGEIVVGTYNRVDHKIELALISKDGKVLRKVKLQSNALPYFVLIPMGNKVLFQVPASHDYYITDFINPPKYHNGSHIPGLDLGGYTNAVKTRNVFDIGGSEYAVADHSGPYSITIINDRLEIIKAKTFPNTAKKQYTTGVFKTEDRIFAIDAFGVTDNADIVLNEYDFDLNLVNSRVLLKGIKVMELGTDKLVAQKTAKGYVIDMVIGMGLSSGSPYTKTVFFDEDFYITGSYTTREPGKGVFVKTLDFASGSMFTWWGGYKLTK